MNDFSHRFRREISFDRLIAARPSIKSGRPGADRRAWVVRPEDLLVLEFELVNLRVEKSEGDDPAELVKQGSGPAYLVVRFPPQHLTEKAYFTTVPGIPVSTPKATDKEEARPEDPDADKTDADIEDPEDPPIQAILSGWSRLVFRVPDDLLPIQWKLEEVLKVMEKLELSVPANALPPKVLRAKWDDLFVSVLDKAKLVDPSLLDIVGTFSSMHTAGEMISASSTTSASAPRLRSRAGGQVIAAARARRKLRTLGNQLGVGGLTGSDTVDLHEKLVGEFTAESFAHILLRPEPGPPGATQTALELPYHIILSPNRFGAWFHAKKPVTSDETGHTELWHTRLGVRRPDGTLIDGDDWRRTLRAVWTTDYPAPSTPAPGDPVDVPVHVNFPWRMSLDSFDRHNVVHLSSNFRLRDPNRPGAFYEPDPLDVDLLALTSLGAWFAAARAVGGGVAPPSDAGPRSLCASGLCRLSVPLGTPRIADQSHRAPVP
jgi:hypothetical protein